MRVYLAGPYAARDILREEAARFAEAGHPSTARWLDATHAITPGTINAAPAHPNAYTTQHALEDFEDIDSADALVLYTGQALMDSPPNSLTHDQTISGGRHIETGYALARQTPVIVIGDPENIFHRGLCSVVPTREIAINILSALGAERQGLIEALHRNPYEGLVQA